MLCKLLILVSVFDLSANSRAIWELKYSNAQFWEFRWFENDAIMVRVHRTAGVRCSIVRPVFRTVRTPKKLRNPNRVNRPNTYCSDFSEPWLWFWSICYGPKIMDVYFIYIIVLHLCDFVLELYLYIYSWFLFLNLSKLNSIVDLSRAGDGSLTKEHQISNLIMLLKDATNV